MARFVFATGSLAYGGAERHAVALINRLGERGHDCDAVYIKRCADLLDRLRLRSGAGAHCLDARRYFDVRAVGDFARHLSRLRPAAVVAANPYALLYASLALRQARLRAPLVVTYHSTRLLGAKERLQMLAYRALFWAADCTVFVSERQRRYCLRRGVGSVRNEVIHNGVDIDEFSVRCDAEACLDLRRELGFDASDYVIGISALLRPEKNHAQLLDALARLRQKAIAARALLIGDGPMRAAIEARARALGIARDVVITGLQRDVRPFILACDCMTLCSHTEAFSLAAIESMALGKPFVHSDVGGAAEMIVPGENGFLFPPRDTQAYADKLAMLSDRALAASMGRAARAVVETRFSEERMVDRYERLLLDEICAHSAGAAAVAGG